MKFKLLVNLSFLIGVVIMLASCSKKLSYFTQDLYEDYDWTVEELKQVQFYLSDDIVLFRELSHDSADIDQGKIKLRNGRKVEEIVFEKGTPGVLSFSPKSNRFAISFDQDDRYLMFGPNQKVGGKFVLLAKDWDRQYGKVTYGNQSYYTSNTSAYASLLVDLDNAVNTSYRVERVKGRTVK